MNTVIRTVLKDDSSSLLKPLLATVSVCVEDFRMLYISPVAAPDHKIRQCIQRSALFPGRAEREAGGAKRLSAERVGSGEIRESGGYAPGKICKNQL